MTPLIWEHGGLRRLLLLALLLSLIPLSAGAAEEEGTLRVLVPSSAANLQAEDRSSRTGWIRVEVPIVGGRAATLERARAEYGPDVIVERVYTLFGPSDEPHFDNQWGLENTGQFGGTPDADADANTAWPVSVGSGVMVAVVDSGIDATHPDLAGQVVPGWDTRDNDGDPSPEGSGISEAHGTMVAGVIAAAVNGEGITGIAPQTTILDMRACLEECFSNDVADAMIMAVDFGADIINISLGSYGTSDPPVETAVEYARVNGVTVVASLGNDNLNVDEFEDDVIIIPAGLPHDNIISTAASDHFDLRAGFSNYGAEGADVFAPGDFILTTATGDFEDYEFMSGTSFAAPFVSGLAALLLSHDPGIGHHELIARVTAFSDTPSGLDGMSRHGRINAGSTLTMRFIDTKTSVFVNTIKWLADQGITEGCNPPENHKYCPGDDVTRGQMAVFFARAFDLDSTSTDYFDDDDGRFYENAANMMAESGITVGCAPRQYCGSRDISRGEMAAMLARVLGLPPASSDHFGDDDGSTFEDAINKIAEAEITQGCNPPDNDRYCPDDDVNRGQMAAFLQRAVKLLD